MTDDVALLKSEVRRLRRHISRLSPSLHESLKRRGFTIYRKDPSEDLLQPHRKYASAFYKMLDRYSFRLFLRDVIKHQDFFSLEKVTRFATEQVSARYLDFLLRSGLVETFGQGFRLKKRPIKSFGETLEWFVARTIKNEFQTETAWGVKFRRPGVGGDYDLIARIDSLLLYMEIKSSPPRQIYDREIMFFLDRADDLSPDLAVFFVDTELRMKDKIVPMFEAEARRRSGKAVRVEQILRELFHINRKIFIINAKGGIKSNIERILTFLWHKEFLPL